MDAEKKEEFRVKFYLLAIHLNAVVLLAAVIVMAFFIAPEPYRIPVVLILVVLEMYLSVTFRKKYLAARAWLHEHADKEKEDEP